MEGGSRSFARDCHNQQPWPMRTPKAIKRGDVITFLPEWRDKGDEKIEFRAAEDYNGDGSLDVVAGVALPFRPVQRVKVSMISTVRVKLASVGNVDHGQPPNRPMYGAERNRIVLVESLAAAAAVCQRFITANDLGAGNWAGGEVYDAAGTLIANVSYNGRIWAGARDMWTPDTKELCTS